MLKEKRKVSFGGYTEKIMNPCSSKFQYFTMLKLGKKINRISTQWKGRSSINVKFAVKTQCKIATVPEVKGVSANGGDMCREISCIGYT